MRVTVEPLSRARGYRILWAAWCRRVAGANGSGKTALLKTMAGLLEPIVRTIERLRRAWPDRGDLRPSGAVHVGGYGQARY